MLPRRQRDVPAGSIEAATATSTAQPVRQRAPSRQRHWLMVTVLLAGLGLLACSFFVVHSSSSTSSSTLSRQPAESVSRIIPARPGQPLESVSRAVLSRPGVSTAAMRTNATAPAASCPNVFIYNRSSLHEPTLRHTGFGERLDPTDPSFDGVWTTDQLHLGSIILSRLLRGSRCRLVDDAAEAAIFIVPLKTAERTHAELDSGIQPFMPPSQRLMLLPVCLSICNDDWRERLPHLDERTVRRHVFVTDKFFNVNG